MKKLLAVLVAIVCISLMMVNVWAEDLTFTSSADVRAMQLDPDEAWGTSPSMPIKFSADGTDFRMGFLKFNVQGIEGKTIASAKIILTTDPNQGAGDVGFEFRKTTSEWTEDAVSYNTKPTWGDKAYGVAPSEARGGKDAGYATYEFALDPSFFDKGDAEYGLAIVPVSGSGDTPFFTRDAEEGKYAPKLVITLGAASNDDDVKENPDTGDAGMIVFGLAAAASAAGLVVSRKRK